MVLFDKERIKSEVKRFKSYSKCIKRNTEEASRKFFKPKDEVLRKQWVEREWKENITLYEKWRIDCIHFLAHIDEYDEDRDSPEKCGPPGMKGYFTEAEHLENLRTYNQDPNRPEILTAPR